MNAERQISCNLMSDHTKQMDALLGNKPEGQE